MILQNSDKELNYLLSPDHICLSIQCYFDDKVQNQLNESMCCRNLFPCSNDGTDSYVRLYLLPDQTWRHRKRTSVKKKTVNPDFDDKYVFFPFLSFPFPMAYFIQLLNMRLHVPLVSLQVWVWRVTRGGTNQEVGRGSEEQQNVPQTGEEGHWNGKYCCLWRTMSFLMFLLTQWNVTAAQSV